MSDVKLLRIGAVLVGIILISPVSYVGYETLYRWLMRETIEHAIHQEGYQPFHLPQISQIGQVGTRCDEWDREFPDPKKAYMVVYGITIKISRSNCIDVSPIQDALMDAEGYCPDYGLFSAADCVHQVLIAAKPKQQEWDEQKNK